MMEKNYLLGQLEKKLNDKDYYMVNPMKQRQFVSEGFEIVNELRGVPLDQEEKKLLNKALSVLMKIQKALR